jgi:hypothetical protein
MSMSALRFIYFLLSGWVGLDRAEELIRALLSDRADRAWRLASAARASGEHARGDGG